MEGARRRIDAADDESYDVEAEASRLRNRNEREFKSPSRLFLFSPLFMGSDGIRDSPRMTLGTMVANAPPHTHTLPMLLSW